MPYSYISSDFHCFVFIFSFLLTAKGKERSWWITWHTRKEILADYPLIREREHWHLKKIKEIPMLWGFYVLTLVVATGRTGTTAFPKLKGWSKDNLV